MENDVNFKSDIMVGARIKDLRHKRKWNQTTLGINVDMKQEEISKIERGVLPISGETAEKFGFVLNSDASYILTGKCAP